MINIEIPIDWINSQTDGDRHRLYFANICTAASKVSTTVQTTQRIAGEDFAARKIQAGELLLSFHTVGEAGNILRIKEAPLFPFYTFEACGHSGWSALANDHCLQKMAKAYSQPDGLAYLDQFTEQYRKNRTSKYQQNAGSDQTESDYVLYLMQMASDPVAYFARMTQPEIIDHLIEYSNATGVKVVFKRHPFCDDHFIESYLAQKLETAQNACVSNGNVIDLIDNARSVVTVNSGSGFETLLLGKSHYSVGSCEWDAISHQIHTPADFNRLFDPQQAQKENTRNYLAYMLNEYWVDITNIDTIAARLNDKLIEVSRDQSGSDQLLTLKITRDEFSTYLKSKNRFSRLEQIFARFEQIAGEHHYLRRKLGRSFKSRIRKALGIKRWYDTY